ncbi:hypothetical protein GE09DRAFT_1167776 [Coniochaeta sp. 2T2.1]|nr:hypothetical protein GE09DRAFT_1167776 [Coniochaeta sp. 2T2.1]
MVQSTTPGDALSPPLKRRRVRRGTQSCWECKRRKIRCSFTVPDESVCDGCRSRGVKCTSQDKAVRSRLAIHLVANNSQIPCISGSDSAGDVARLLGIPDGSDILCRTLVDAWPTRQDIDLILRAPIGTAVLFHGLICKPYSSGLSEMPSTEKILQPPPCNAHPVLTARRLLLLAVLLQGIPRGFFRHLGPFGVRYVETMSCLVQTARLVTSNDDMVSSLEGIECIMIESMYHNNAGNIRRAWVTHRRAMVIAQVLGFHRNPEMPVKLTVLDSETRTRIDPEYMWYRLVITDRYLSLVLGLPQCSDEIPFELSGIFLPCTPMEQMERMESMGGGLIIQRNRQYIHDLDKTREIDNLLQEAAALMPPQWWLPPKIATLVSNDNDAANETLRLMSQFTHYHLLAQTHLPYLLQPPTSDRRYDYHKITAVTASRELLSRFVSFRSSDSVAAYCRGVDFLAFIASTILAVAHISNHHHRRLRLDRESGGGTMGFLVHQRPADRGLLEQTLQCMESMYQGDPETDILAYKIAAILRQLLAIENAAANGASYSMTVSSEQGEAEEPGTVEAGPDSNITANVNVAQELRVHIPHFGTIKPSYSAGATYEAETLAFVDVDRADNGSPFFMEFGMAFDVDDWGLQGVDSALFENLVKGDGASGAETSPSGE